MKYWSGYEVASGPEATIVLRDGSRVSGEVLATSPAQLTLTYIKQSRKFRF